MAGAAPPSACCAQSSPDLWEKPWQKEERWAWLPPVGPGPPSRTTHVRRVYARANGTSSVRAS